MDPFFYSKSFYGKQKPYRFEADVHDCEIVGTVPKSLNGKYFRLGPDRIYPTIESDIILNGDGVVSAFNFENGHVDYCQRYVKTERYLAECKARQRLYGIYRNAVDDDPLTEGTDRDNTANTSAFFHHGELFALREDSIPHRIDPFTLETLPKAPFDELASKTVTAHPKIDPVTGEWWSFGLFSQKEYRGEMSLHVFDRNGKLIRQEEFMTPYPGVAHDFVVTRDHVVFPIMPLTVDIKRVENGGDFYAYDPNLTPQYGVMPRNGSAKDIRWFEVPLGFAGHFMNAFSEGNAVYVDGVISKGNSFSFFNDIEGNPTDFQDGIGTVSRVKLDLDSDEAIATTTPFAGAMGEMPQIDQRFAMSKYRYGYIKTRDGVARLDWEMGKLQTHSVGPERGTQEAIFVPRSPDAPEGDGYLMFLANHHTENRAELIILDAMNVEKEPLATVKLPFNLQASFHGTFVSASELQKIR